MNETDAEIEARIRREMAEFPTIGRIRLLSGYEIAALLRILDKERETRDGPAK